MRYVATTTLLASLSVAAATECMLDYQEYSKKDYCLAGIAQKDDKRYFANLITGGDSLKDTNCFAKSPNSIQTDCAADPNKVATMNVFAGDTTCDAAVTPTAVELQIDGACNEVQAPDGTGGQVNLFYKANPVPPPPTCFATYAEFKNEQDCIDGVPLPDGDPALHLASYVGEANVANHVHNVCVDKTPDSRRIQCNSGVFKPDSRAKIETFTGDATCGLATNDQNYHSAIIEASATCKLAVLPDGQTTFWYKASPAKCFKWYYEFGSESDCSNNKNPLEGSDLTFPFLIGASNEENSYDKSCNVHKARSFRVSCNTAENGAFEETVADTEFIVETYSASDCNLKDDKPEKMTKLKVDNLCNNFVYQDKTVWYKSVQNSDTAETKPGEEKLSDGASCADNLIAGDDNDDNNGKRCVEWNSKPAKCNSMGFPGEFEMGLYKKKARLATLEAPNSNLCRVTCIDNGDIFCVNKNDLQSNPVCCPKECNDPDNGDKNQCSNTLKVLGTHVCSDQFPTARDEFKYLLCPREDMESDCGKDKVFKLDLSKDKLEDTITYNVPWYKPYSLMYPDNAGPTYNFKKLAVCSYAFVFPAEAGSSSAMTISFKGSDEENKNVQAYYATYLGTKDDKATISPGEVMSKYDGKWDRMFPTDPPTDEEKLAEYTYLQQRVPPADGEKKQFLEQNQLIDLLGQGGDLPSKQIKLQLSNQADKNVSFGFVTITTQFTEGTDGEEKNKKVIKKQGGAFNFEVKTNFRRKPGAVVEESEAVKTYEKEQEEKREQALLIVLFGLAGVVGLVILIFIYQAICSKHTQYEVQKRTLNYKKEDAIIRHTLKVRKSTMAAKVGNFQRGTIKSDYKNVPNTDRQIAEVDADQEDDGDVDKKQAPVGESTMQMNNLDVSEKVDFEKNEQIMARNIAQKDD